MLVVGLTGGIASGKSTVSKILSSPPYNIPILDADLLAREAIEPGSKGFEDVVKSFGPTVLSSNGEIDRATLGEIIFNSPPHRKILNGIVHPYVRQQLLKGVLKCWLQGKWIVVLDIPLLVETGLWKMVGSVVVVYVSEQIQLNRLLSRPPIHPSPQLTLKDAQSRIASQAPLMSKLPYATHILDNSGSPQDLSVSINSLYKKWQKDRRGWWLSWLIPLIGVFWAVWYLAGNWRKVRGRLNGMERRRGRGEAGSSAARADAETIELRVMDTRES